MQVTLDKKIKSYTRKLAVHKIMSKLIYTFDNFIEQKWHQYVQQIYKQISMFDKRENEKEEICWQHKW